MHLCICYLNYGCSDIQTPNIDKLADQGVKITNSDQACISFDLTRSVLNAAGIKNAEKQLDGIDIISHVANAKADFDRSLYWRRKRGENVRKAIRDGHFKCLLEHNKGKLVNEKLFDLSTDPSGKSDFLGAIPGKTEILRQKLSSWETDVQSPCLKGFKQGDC